MGRSITPKYVIDTLDASGLTFTTAWDCKRYGRPTAVNIENFIKLFNYSLKPGRINAHLGSEATVTKGTIYVNTTAPRQEVATFRKPSFEVI